MKSHTETDPRMPRLPKSELAVAPSGICRCFPR